MARTEQTNRPIAPENLRGLTRQEQEWLTAFRRQLAAQFAGLVEEVVVFGSKARGEATADSDVDVLLVIRRADWKQKEAVARVGHELALGTDVVPSLMVYTAEEWAQRRRTQAPLWQTISRDGVRLE